MYASGCLGPFLNAQNLHARTQILVEFTCKFSLKNTFFENLEFLTMLAREVTDEISFSFINSTPWSNDSLPSETSVSRQSRAILLDLTANGTSIDERASLQLGLEYIIASSDMLMVMWSGIAVIRIRLRSRYDRPESIIS